MGWLEVMRKLEDKVTATLRGHYHPLDGVPFFRVQYPPQQEHKALLEFRSLAQRLRQAGWHVESISLTEVLRETLIEMLNCPPKKLRERLEELETERERHELQTMLSEHLPERLAEKLFEKLGELPQNSIIILLRTGALFPFVRPSALLSRLEGRINCIVILAYPGMTLGELLEAPPASLHSGYYRGETICWE
ncbi:MAG: hypothetical protein DRG83_11730 [Deltaproteobacteria bacterium]|nr:MAG: hypothetical protein DRG83_11730 [Deltaproteobacteria bacterium]